MHGLGFAEQVEQDGDFPTRVIEITETLNGIIIDRREATIKSRTIYDEQLYSETNSDLLINLSGSQRAAAITSETRLLWEGTDDGRNSCSYGQRMAELKSSSAKAQDGKPRLHAPSTYDPIGSVSHTHANTEDLMEAFVPGTKKHGPYPRHAEGYGLGGKRRRVPAWLRAYGNHRCAHLGTCDHGGRGGSEI